MRTDLLEPDNEVGEAHAGRCKQWLTYTKSAKIWPAMAYFNPTLVNTRLAMPPCARQCSDCQNRAREADL